ncbi:hypothetical protein AB1L88_11680 [Tautonia sp. JC769]|uniref:hypothetical protein n=1 Tax=Tautonia sp. JC769 TaxID=3232135 RepID=UPI003459CEB3
MSIPTRHPRRSAASTWPAWTDEVRWTLGPTSPDLDDPDSPPSGRLVCSCGRVLVESDLPGPDQIADGACYTCGAAERPSLDEPCSIAFDKAPEDSSSPF